MHIILSSLGVADGCGGEMGSSYNRHLIPLSTDPHPPQIQTTNTTFQINLSKRGSNVHHPLSSTTYIYIYNIIIHTTYYNSPFFLLRSASRLALACIAIFFSLSVDLLLELLLDRRDFDLRISSLSRDEDLEEEGILLPSSSSLYFTDLRVDFRSVC